MGMPFPKATLRVGELVDWGFAVNGTASVLGSTGILLVAFTWGFDAALAVGGALYLLAGLLLAPAPDGPAAQRMSAAACQLHHPPRRKAAICP